MDFPGQKKRTIFEPDRVLIQTSQGDLISAYDDPERSFEGHTLETPWDDANFAYFSGEAMWINNAVSQTATLLAIAVSAPIFCACFRVALHNQMKEASVPPSVLGVKVAHYPTVDGAPRSKCLYHRFRSIGVHGFPTETRDR